MKENNILNLFKPYIEFSKKITENDENVAQISNIILNSSETIIQKYYSDLFNPSLLLGSKYKKIIKLFRILTINKIRRSVENSPFFRKYNEFEQYINEFKENLKSKSFPDYFIEDIKNVKEIQPFKKDEKIYNFDEETIRNTIEINPDALEHQFQNYGKFNFFRHFMLHATDEGSELKEAYLNLWEKLQNHLFELLNLNGDEYYFDQCKFYYSSGRMESEVTWGALLKKEIGNISIEEDKRTSLQLYFMISSNGLRIGISLGNTPNDQIRGIIRGIANANKKDIINYIKNLKTKYSESIQIRFKRGFKYFNKVIDNAFLNDDIRIQEEIFDLFKIDFSIVYDDFDVYNSSINEFNSIIKDFFRLYMILIGEAGVKILPPPIKSITTEDRFKDYKFTELKLKMIEEFENLNLIGIPWKKIIDKILKILESKKNLILYGAPGTGKTIILEKIFEVLSENLDIIDGFIFTTATSDWTVFETIGGLVPGATDILEFRPGIFLNCFREAGRYVNKWLIVDELNRANIDKVFGYFFSLLSNQEVVLPFKTSSQEIIKIVPLQKWINDGMQAEEINSKLDESSEAEHFFIFPNWRMGGTINSSDKASLYQLSHAFIRRFAFVEIPLPEINMFMENYKFKCVEEKKKQLKIIWEIVNKYYKIGPAIIIDMDKLLESIELDIFDSFEAYIYPQIETLPDDTITKLIEELINSFGGVEGIGIKFEKYKILS